MKASKGIKLAQCLSCDRDPRTCGCTPKNEDRRGLCKEYVSIFDKKVKEEDQ